MKDEQSIVSSNTAKKILKKSGVERTTKLAIDRFQHILENYAVFIAKRAVILAKHAKRDTVESKDIKMVIIRKDI